MLLKMRIVAFFPNYGGLQANKSAASVMELELIETDVDVLTSLVIKDKEEHTALLNPVFRSDILSYTYNVGYDSDCITVIPVASKTTASITVNGQELIGGKASVSMTGGLNNIEIKVTSAGGYTVTYVVTVTRASSPYLASVAMTGFRIPGFSKTTYSYNLTTRNLASTKVTLSCGPVKPVGTVIEETPPNALEDTILTRTARTAYVMRLNPGNSNCQPVIDIAARYVSEKLPYAHAQLPFIGLYCITNNLLRYRVSNPCNKDCEAFHGYLNGTGRCLNLQGQRSDDVFPVCLSLL